jgi:hypothetical protein
MSSKQGSLNLFIRWGFVLVGLIFPVLSWAQGSHSSKNQSHKMKQVAPKSVSLKQKKQTEAGFMGPRPAENLHDLKAKPQIDSQLLQSTTAAPARPRKIQKATAFRSVEATEQQANYRADGSIKTITAMVFATQAQSIYDFKDGTKRTSQSIMMNLSGRLSDNYTLVGRLSASRDLVDTESDVTNGLSDLLVVLAKRHSSLTPWLRGGGSLTSVLGTSKFSREYQNFYGNVGATYTLSLTDAWLAPGFNASLTLGANRNFHQFETDKAGRILNQYGLREILAAGYSFNSFSFSFEFVHRHAWNYKGFINQAFEHTEEISYFITPQWSVALGHTNSGSWLAPNGRDSNLKLINENDSMVYSSMSVVF